MEVVNCFWELANIGKRTVEIDIDEDDSFDAYMFQQYLQGFEYAVVKVPMNKPDFNRGLSSIGFACIETQMKVGIEMKDFDFGRNVPFEHDLSFKIVNNDLDFSSIIKNIKAGMFSTDRISIDNHFGYEIGCRRYKNWLLSEYQNQQSIVVKMMMKETNIGFFLVKIEDEIMTLLLNGLYKQFQHKGLGLLTPASPMIFAKRHHLPILKEVTSISSNNIPVVRLYNRLHFQLLQQKYVFIKHL